MGSAQSERQVSAGLLACREDHARSTSEPGELHHQKADDAAAENGDTIAGPDARDVEAMQAAGERFAKGTMHGIDVVG